MSKFKKILSIVMKILQVIGIGLGTAAVTDPSSLEGLIPADQVQVLAGAAAVLNAFLPSVIGRKKQ